MARKSVRTISVNQDPAFSYGEELELIVPVERRGKNLQQPTVTPETADFTVGHDRVETQSKSEKLLVNSTSSISVNISNVSGSEESVFEVVEDSIHNRSQSQLLLQNEVFPADDADSDFVNSYSSQDGSRKCSSTRYGFLDVNKRNFWSVHHVRPGE